MVFKNWATLRSSAKCSLFEDVENLSWPRNELHSSAKNTEHHETHVIFIRFFYLFIMTGDVVSVLRVEEKVSH
jgi:hypothetical protein